MTQLQPGDVLHLRGGAYAPFTVTVNDVTIQSWGSERATITAPTNDVNIQNTVWVNATGATLRNLDIVGGYYYALKFEQGDGHVIRCKISGSGRDCVKIVPDADDITIEQSEIFNSGLRDNSNAEGIDNVNADNMTVRDCYIHDIATNGAYAKGGAINALFERCLVMNCGHAGIMLGQSAGTTFLDTTQNPTYKENIDGIVRNCIVVNTDGAGIACQAALRPKVQNNTLVNVAEGSNGGLYMASTTHNSVERECEDVEFSNNIVVLSATSARPMVFITATGLTGSLTMRNNRYHNDGGSAVFWDERVPTYSWTLTQWQTSLSTDSGTTEGSPGLDASWHLAGGSACIGTGFTLAGFGDDYDGNTRSGGWDIGADQTGVGALTTPPGGTIYGTGGGTPDLPAAPSGCTATVQTGQYIIVGWTDNSTTESGYRIERRVGSGGFATLLTVAANAVSHFDGNVVDGQDYTYRVIALGPAGESAPSNEDTATMVGTPPPSGGGGGGGGSDGGGGCSLGSSSNSAWALLAVLGLLGVLTYRRVQAS